MGTYIKEFKKFEKMFSRGDLFKERSRWLTRFGELKQIQACGDFEKRWDLVVESWAQNIVQHAVYKADDHLEWQRFRVSLKGLDTADKLRMLFAYWHDMCFLNHDRVEIKNLHKCRVDNYIGALVRGGQLSTSYEVLK